MKIDTLIFDMDGVITTEEKYWACARLTLWEMVTQTLAMPEVFGDAVHDTAIRESLVPDHLIYALKGRAVNSNWDIAYMVVCVYLASLPDAMVLSAPEVTDLLQAISDTKSGAANWPQALADFLATTHGAKGRALIQEAGNRLRKALDFGDGELLRVEGPFWWYLHEQFQGWYSGEAMQQFGASPLPDGTVLPPEQLETVLKQLRAAGYTIGAATGRPRDELNDALDGVGLLNFFDANHVATLDIVRQTERKLGIVGLVKPHPFTLLRAIYPRADTRVLLDEEFQKIKRNNVVVIGDSTSDVLMAKAAGCRMVGVLTGVRGEEARQERYHLLIHAGCEALLDNVTELPDWLEGQGN